MRAGLIGVGRFGRRYLQTLEELPAVSLVAVASRNPETPALLPAGCSLHEDWRELLRRDDLDAVLVVTPPASHADIVAAAVRRGLAVLVEKPLTLDVGEAEALLALPRSAPLMVEHTHLFSPAYVELRRRAPAERILLMEVDAGAHGPWRADVPVLWDWGAHWVAVCLDLMGETPVGCESRVETASPPADGLTQSVQATLHFATGAEARLAFSNVLDAPRRRLRVHLVDGRVLVYDQLADAPLVAVEPDGLQRVVDVEDRPPLREALASFETLWQAWQAGELREPRSGLSLGVHVVRTLDACQHGRVA